MTDYLYLPPSGGVTLPISLANLAQDGATLNQVIQWNGAQWVAATISSGGVTSVGLSMPGIFSVTGSPVTTSGTLTASLISQTANQVFAAPNGVSGAPSFRALVAADIPTIPSSGISGLAAVATSGSASDLTTGSLVLARIAQGGATLNQVLQWNGSAWAPATLGGGSGTVTSVGLSLPSLFSVSGSPVTSSGTLTATYTSTQLTAPVDGNLLLTNAAGTDFSLLQLGGTTSSFPALLRNGNTLGARFADNSANTGFIASTFSADTSGYFGFATGGYLRSGGTNGVLRISNALDTDFGRLQFGGSTASFPALKRSTTSLQVRLADDSADAGLSAATLTTSNTAATSITSGGGLTVASTGSVIYSTRAQASSPADSQLLLRNNAGTDFDRVMLGGTTSTFPSLQRSSAGLRARLADDSANASFTASTLTTTAAATNAVQYTAAGGQLTDVSVNATATNQYLRQVSSGVPAFAQVTPADLSAGGAISGNVLQWNGSNWVPSVAGSSALSNAEIEKYFGTGADGSVTFDGSTTILGLVPSSGTYTMTRDIHCINITLTGATTAVQTNGYKIYAQGTLDISDAALSFSAIRGWLPSSGNGGTGAAATTAGTAGPIPFTQANVTLPAGRAGVAGGTGAGGAGGAGTAATANQFAHYTIQAGAAGGAGGTGAAAGGAAGANPASTRFIRWLNSEENFLANTSMVSSVGTGHGSGGGAGGWAGSGTGPGGGGSGAAAPTLFVAARTINRRATPFAGLIRCTGANGGNGGTTATSNAGGGGGGGGGSGGLVYFRFQTLTGGAGTNEVEVTGGTGGTGGNGLGTGLGGAGGGGGASGIVVSVNIGTGITSISTPNAAVAATAISGTATGVAGAAPTTNRFTLV